MDFYHSVERDIDPQQFGGNRGDGTDLWDGSSNRKNFTPETNPSTAGYFGPRPPKRFPQPINKLQNVFTGIYIENIRRKSADPAGVMRFDVRFAPLVPNDLQAAIGEDQVLLSWTKPADNGAPVASYKVRYRPSSDTGWTGEPTVAAPDNEDDVVSHTVTGLSVDTEYYFEVSAVSGIQNELPGLEGPSVNLTATPQRAIDGPISPDFVEIPPYEQNWDSLVGRYAKSGSYDWSLEGLDALRFRLDSTEDGFRELHFRSPPDWESKADTPKGGDTEGDNVYEVTVKAETQGPGGASSNPDHRYMLPVTVTVINVNEIGTATVSPAGPYRVDQQLTATLTDPDSPGQDLTDLMGTRWKWKRAKVIWGVNREHNIVQDEATIPNATTSVYTAGSEDRGFNLRAIAYYEDGHPDTGERTKYSDWTEPVVAAPAAPENLLAAPRAGAVLLTWEKGADHASALTGYEYRQSTDGGATWDPDWTAIAPPPGKGSLS